MDRSFTVTIQGEGLSDDDYARAALSLWYALWSVGLGDRAVVHPDSPGVDEAVNRQYDEMAEHCPWAP
ncbi:hypothetical protein JOF56_005702 [Kibdelosporangium banguiense]|uniref:GyrI-like small molecule binding domain-containing protein n=1 Tax=Kibdelosporangium banguiense TaxID=1365924 RepID=A0ABS4TLN4_9PSEU|nr:hypothetical protein [Kibdelosporangium banguiense]MBP2325317.1 hypothetical protein [Kibdelosporangium banguiense]